MLLRKGHPARTTHPIPVTILRQDWLPDIRTGQIIGKQFIYNQGDTGIIVAFRNPFVVKGCGRSNGKIISLIAIPLRIYPVQGERHDSKHICTNGIGRPCGIDFAGSHILNVIPVFDIVVFRTAVIWRSVMHHNIFRHHHPAKHDFSRFTKGFNLRFRYLRRILLVKRMCRNHKHLSSLLILFTRIHGDILQRCCIC